MANGNGGGWILLTAAVTATIAVAGERLYQRYQDLNRENRQLKTELKEACRSRQQESE